MFEITKWLKFIQRYGPVGAGRKFMVFSDTKAGVRVAFLQYLNASTNTL